LSERKVQGYHKRKKARRSGKLLPKGIERSRNLGRLRNQGVKEGGGKKGVVVTHTNAGPGKNLTAKPEAKLTGRSWDSRDTWDIFVWKPKRN